MSILSTIAPQWALKRALARASLERLYSAAKSHHQHLTPTNSRGSADAVMEHARDKVTVWARHLDENHDVVTGLLSTLARRTSNITIEPAVKMTGGDLNVRVNDELAEAFDRWKDTADLAMGVGWSDLTATACRSFFRDGEVFVNHIFGGDRPVLPYALEILESDFVPFDLTQQNPTIIHGIEKDANGRMVAVHFFRDHPGNTESRIGALIASRETIRVPVEFVSHAKHTKRLHQTRGISVLHPVIHRLDDIHEVEDSERIRYRIQSSVSLFIKSQPQWGQTPAVNAISGEQPFEMDAGQVHRLQPGEDVIAPTTTSPNPGHADFLRGQYRAVAAGTGTRYSTLARDYTDGSYSSQRQELVESRMFEDMYCESWTAQFLKPIWRRFVQSTQLSGRVSFAGADPESIFDAEYSGVSIPWIDLQKEVSADAAAVTAGFKARTQVIRERGGNVREVDRQRRQDTEAPQPELTVVQGVDDDTNDNADSAL